MTRPRKAQPNTVVELSCGFGVVVAYRTDVKSNRYGVVSTDWRGATPRGAVVWLDPSEFEPTDRKSKKPGRIYRANKKQGDRGCTCQCCVHVRGVEPEPED